MQSFFQLWKLSETVEVDSLRPMLSQGTKDIGSIIVTGYRVGAIDNPYGRGIFFAGDESGAKAYSVFHPDSPIQKYELHLNNVLLAGHQNDVTKKFFNKSYGDLVDSLGARAKSQVQGGRNLDVKIAKAAKKMGYDAIIYLRPAPPADNEIVVFKNVAGMEVA